MRPERHWKIHILQSPATVHRGRRELVREEPELPTSDLRSTPPTLPSPQNISHARRWHGYGSTGHRSML